MIIGALHGCGGVLWWDCEGAKGRLDPVEGPIYYCEVRIGGLYFDNYTNIHWGDNGAVIRESSLWIIYL